MYALLILQETSPRLLVSELGFEPVPKTRFGSAAYSAAFEEKMASLAVRCEDAV